MGVFDQMGDPVCPPCLCQHHEIAYTERESVTPVSFIAMLKDDLVNNTTLVNVQITITETCCVVVNAATMTVIGSIPTDIEIERPLGTIRTTQRDAVDSSAVKLLHHAAWEVLPPGVYTYYLVNRSGATITVYGEWIKAIASDCEG